ncbi:hypothetical protein ACFO0J_01655 [Castellaniella hirudinis]|uniref:O-antigen/teichoic acid export membrane protein n=1 Tax=Castellaniella hirudinis TaxID=1144617 RepID=A0ABV8RU86_9BURK
MVSMYMSFPSEGYVAYSAAIAAGVIGSQIASGWIASSVIFYFPLRKGKADFIIQVMKIAVASVVLSSVITASIFFLFFRNLTLSISVLFLIIVQGLFYVAVSLFQPERRMRGQVVSAFVLCMAQLLFAGYVILVNNHSLPLSVAGYGAGFLAGLVTLFLYIRWTWFTSVFLKRQRRLAATESPFENSRFLAYGGPMFLWFALMLVSSYTDRFFLGQVGGPGVAGYAFTKDILIGVSGFISMPIMLIAHSMIFRLFREKKKQELSQLIEFSTTLLAVLFLAAIFFYVSFVKVQLTYFSPDLQHVSFFRAFLIGVGIMISTLALYSQKKFEVLGHLKQLVVLAAISNAVALLAYMYSSYSQSLDYFAISYVACALLYFCLTLWVGEREIRFTLNYRMVAFVLAAFVMMHFLAPSAIYNGSVNWKAVIWAVAWILLLVAVLLTCLFRLFRSLSVGLIRD